MTGGLKRLAAQLSYFFFDPLTGFRRHHTPRRLANALVNQLFRRVFRSTYVPGYPLHLSIEVNNTCDLKCPMCSSGQDYSRRRRGFMSFEQYRRIIDETAPYLYKVGPFNLGEPLLHKDIFRMVRYARDKGVATILSTNGNTMDEQKAAGLIESGLEELIVSIDAATEGTYRQNRPGGDFDRLKKNVRRLMELKRERGSRTPFVAINMILMDNNVGEIEAFKQLAAELGVDKCNFSTYWEMYLGDSQKEGRTRGFRPKSAEHRNIMPENMRVDTTCGWAWSGCVIAWNGSVTPCCFDYNETCVLGNVFDGGLKQLWNNQKYRRLRAAILKGRKTPKLCAGCPRVF